MFSLSKGMTQEAFAYLCGIDQPYLSQIECAKRNVTLDVVEVLASQLGVSVAQFFGAVVTDDQPVNHSRREHRGKPEPVDMARINKPIERVFSGMARSGFQQHEKRSPWKRQREQSLKDHNNGYS